MKVFSILPSVVTRDELLQCRYTAVELHVLQTSVRFYFQVSVVFFSCIITTFTMLQKQLPLAFQWIAVLQVYTAIGHLVHRFSGAIGNGDLFSVKSALQILTGLQNSKLILYISFGMLVWYYSYHSLHRGP